MATNIDLASTLGAGTNSRNPREQPTTTNEFIAYRIEHWRACSAQQRKLSADPQATIFELCAQDLETAWSDWLDELLDLETAAAISGKSYSSIQKKVRSGEIPNSGRKGRPRIRRRDLTETKHQEIATIDRSGANPAAEVLFDLASAER